MLSSTTIPILLLTMVLTQSPSVPRSQEECHTAPARDSLEEILGKPVECVGEKADVCYRNNNIKVHFNSSNRAETIFMSDSCSGVAGLAAFMNELVPKDIRGKSLKRPIISGSTSCQARSYVEEYECLNIEYFEGNNCMDCNDGSVKIKWK
jgi:hypothetical protein